MKLSGKTRILVTGASGFIGPHVVRMLQENNIAVRILARSRQSTIIPGNNTEVVYGDITKSDLHRGLLKDIGTVVHLAGYAHAENDPQADLKHREITQKGTERIAQMAGEQGVKTFIYISSVKAIGESTIGCVGEEVRENPTSSYGKARLLAEQAVEAAGNKFGMKTIILRLPLVYGPGVKGNLLSMLRKIDAGKMPSIPPVRNRRSMVSVDDVVQAIGLAIAEGDKAGGNGQIKVVITDGQPYSTRDIYVLMMEALNRRIPFTHVPLFVFWFLATVGQLLQRITGKKMPFDHERYRKMFGTACYRTDGAMRILGFRPRITLEQSLPKIVQSYKKKTGRVQQ